MSAKQKLSLVVLRISLGWLMLYAGITKIVDPAWSAEGYIKGAKSFVWFYHWLLNPSVLPMVNIFVMWGLTLLGISLILGIFVRLSSVLGALLMFLFYLAALDFPYPNAHAYIVDEHIIYMLVLCVFYCTRAGRIWGLDAWLGKFAWLGKLT